MPEGPVVSTIIPHYGDPGRALALIDRLAAQVGHVPMEIIVSDDASPTPFPERSGVRVVRRTTNGGFGSAVNSGAALATGEYLLILNSDLEVAADFVARMVAESRPFQPAVTAPAMTDHAGHPAWTARRFPTVAHQVTEWLTPLARFRHTSWWHRRVGHDLHARPGTTVTVDWLVGAALLIPTTDFRAVGGFDERFFMNAEEIDLQRRLTERGLTSVYLGGITVVHEGGGSSDSGFRRRWLSTARLTYARKWGGVRRLQVALTAATGLNLAVNGLRRGLGSPVRPWQTAREEWRLIWADDPRSPRSGSD